MKAKFITLYAANLAEHSAKNPGLYVQPHDGWLGLAGRMVESIIGGTGNLSDVARKTAKQLGGKPTYAGVKELCLQGTP